MQEEKQAANDGVPMIFAGLFSRGGSSPGLSCSADLRQTWEPPEGCRAVAPVLGA